MIIKKISPLIDYELASSMRTAIGVPLYNAVESRTAPPLKFSDIKNTKIGMVNHSKATNVWNTIRHNVAINVGFVVRTSLIHHTKDTVLHKLKTI